MSKRQVREQLAGLPLSFCVGASKSQQALPWEQMALRPHAGAFWRPAGLEKWIC